MKKLRLIHLFLLLTSVLVYNCVEFEPVSPVPDIQFISLEKGIVYPQGDTSNIPTLGAIVKFSFIDGDADLGIYDYVPDTIDELLAKRNCFIEIYEKIDSATYNLIDTSDFKYESSYRIPHHEKLDRVGQNKTVKGNIVIDIPFGGLPPWDTFRYGIKIYDRALNESNQIFTSDISVTAEEINQINW